MYRFADLPTTWEHLGNPLVAIHSNRGIDAKTVIVAPGDSWTRFGSATAVKKRLSLASSAIVTERANQNTN